VTAPLRVAFTVDLEPDCPPFLSGFRGVTEGLPILLGLLEEQDVRATFFTTGDVARRHGDAVSAVLRAGHELGCHGMTHARFSTMDAATARWEIEESARILRAFTPVTAFRAPYLDFPVWYLHLLADAGFTVDASGAKYKRAQRHAPVAGLRRIAASTTSSVLRLPAAARTPLLTWLADPVVLFMHPWELVDLRRERIRYDCRFRTGAIALRCLRDVLTLYRRRGARFMTISEVAA
jgi:peptidoglycan-N-acetylglucosamine deacetylase